MKTTELMIGDRVILKNTHREPTAERIYAIGADCVLIQTEYSRQSYSLDKISPIPLTPKLLEKNGFVSQWANRYVMNGDDVRLIIDEEATPHTYYVDIEHTSITCELRLCLGYVHELQHALRLVDLNDLADNFKID